MNTELQPAVYIGTYDNTASALFVYYIIPGVNKYIYSIYIPPIHYACIIRFYCASAL